MKRGSIAEGEKMAKSPTSLTEETERRDASWRDASWWSCDQSGTHIGFSRALNPIAMYVFLSVRECVKVYVYMLIYYRAKWTHLTLSVLWSGWLKCTTTVKLVLSLSLFQRRNFVAVSPISFLVLDLLEKCKYITACVLDGVKILSVLICLQI